MKNVTQNTQLPEVDASSPALLVRTVKVLELLAQQAAGLQLFDIAERLNIPRSATHRVLTGLVEQGYVQQGREQGFYQLTARIASLAFTFLAGSGITDLAQPILDRLAAETTELVRLALVDGRELIWVAKAQGSQFGLRYDPDMGQIGRLSCSASGQAWLACLSDDAALALVERQGFGLRQHYGPNAPETPADLLAILQQTRARGYAIALQSYAPWMSAAAAAVRNPLTGEVAGVVVIAGPHLRLTEQRLVELSPLLLQAAKEMSVAMTSPLLPAKARAQGGNFFNAPLEARGG